MAGRAAEVKVVVVVVAVEAVLVLLCVLPTLIVDTASRALAPNRCSAADAAAAGALAGDDDAVGKELSLMQ